METLKVSKELSVLLQRGELSTSSLPDSRKFTQILDFSIFGASTSHGNVEEKYVVPRACSSSFKGCESLSYSLEQNPGLKPGHNGAAGQQTK